MKQYRFNLYIRDENEQHACDSRAHMFHILKKYLNQKY